MPRKPISELPAVSEGELTDALPLAIVEDGITGKVTLGDLTTYIETDALARANEAYALAETKVDADGSDVQAADFRTALGLGDSATRNVGLTAGTVAEGDVVAGIQDDIADLQQTTGVTKVVATVAELAGIPTPVEYDRAEVRADPLGDVTDGNGVWGYDGSAWVWISPLIPEMVQDLIDSLEEASILPCSVGGSANAVTLTPAAGYAISGTNQFLVGTAAGNNSGNMTAAVAGAFGGAATTIRLPYGVTAPYATNGFHVPPGTVRTGKPFILRQNTTHTQWDLIYPTFQQQSGVILLEYVSGETALVYKMAQPGIKYPTTLYGVVFRLRLPSDKPIGSPSITIYENDGTTAAISGAQIRDKNGDAMTPQALWAQYDVIDIQRNSSTNNFEIQQAPSATLNTLANMAFAAEYDLPTVEDVIYGIREQEDCWLLKCRNVNGATRNDTIHVIKLYNMGDADSQGVLQNTNNWSWNSQWLEHKGRRFNYANLSSAYAGAGSFTGLQPSTPELAFRVGLMSDTNLNGVDGSGHPLHDFYGYGHGLIEEVSTTFTLDGAGDYTDSNVGTEIRGNEIIITTLLNIYRPYIAVEGDVASRWIGQAEYVYTINSTGMHFSSTHWIGQRLYYDAGVSAFSAGQTVVGLTSGASATVIIAPTSKQTGSAGSGTLAGALFLEGVTGTFQDDEELQVSGVTKAVVNGAIGGQISMQNGYGPMLPTTVVDSAKVDGYSAIVIGAQDGSQQPSALPGSTWPSATRLQFYHSDDGDVIFEVLVPNGPIDPPGDFSEDTTSAVFVQDRAEGVRKGYFNARSGTAVALFEGTYTTEQTYRFRIGSPV